jgi:hypothetical protein
MTVSPIQKELERLEKKEKILDLILSVAKTSGGHISDDGKNLYFILRKAGLKKSEIARVLDVTPAALTPYGDP